MDWHAWHAAYADEDSALTKRLRTVQTQVRNALDGCPPGPVRAVSLCAGQGLDLIGVLADHPRRGDVTARLVEQDPRNVAAARAAAAAAGLPGIEVVEGDAALTRLYAGAVPADLVLVCGVFGNITEDDIERTVAHCAQLCARGGTLVWTRNRKAPDLVPRVCDWLENRGFTRQWLSPPGQAQGVGVHRFTGTPEPLVPDGRMFTFVGYDVLRARAPRTAP